MCGLPLPAGPDAAVRGFTACALPASQRRHCACAGHRKAVSYVRYLSAGELVSASTDSTLRMWDVQAHRELRTFSGHMNEKNFVGLSVDGDFTACGSETNEVRGPAMAAWCVLSLDLCAAARPAWWGACRGCLGVSCGWWGNLPAAARLTAWEEAEEHTECSMQHTDVAWAGAACLPGPSAALPAGLAPKPLLLLCSLQPAGSSKCGPARLVPDCLLHDFLMDPTAAGPGVPQGHAVVWLQKPCLSEAADLLPLLQVYVYYKAMSKPMSRRLFSLPGEPPLPSQQDPHQFISAVCWKPRSQVLLAANSQGTIKIFQLTS